MLLHMAYKQLAELGLNYTATYQDSAVTRQRVDDGHCVVGEVNGRLVATITYYRPGLYPHCPKYQQDLVGVIGQFGVLPELQGTGIGNRLLSVVEKMAAQDQCRELALDTAEPAIHLHHYYERRGYRIVDYVQWEGKTYRSVIMSKTL